MKKFKVLLVIVFILFVFNLFFVEKIFSLWQELSMAKSVVKNQVANEKIVQFTETFIDKVLASEEEVNFETRLQLENQVRALNNKQIFEQWDKFVNTQSEEEAQQEVIVLLKMLVGNMKRQK